MSDNGSAFKGSLEQEHPFETMCAELEIKHICTKPYRGVPPKETRRVELSKTFYKLQKVTELLS